MIDSVSLITRKATVLSALFPTKLSDWVSSGITFFLGWFCLIVLQSHRMAPIFRTLIGSK